MTNREEVAKKWREVGERLDKEPPISLTGTACITLFELLESAGIRDNNSYSDVFSRLADLIDPTCHVDVIRQCEIENVTRYTAECSSCGAVFGDFTTRQKARAAIHSAYCPHCGARVVRDD